MADDQAIARTGFAKRCSAWNVPFNFLVLRGIDLACRDSHDAYELQVLYEQPNRPSFPFHLKYGVLSKEPWLHTQSQSWRFMLLFRDLEAV